MSTKQSFKSTHEKRQNLLALLTKALIQNPDSESLSDAIDVVQDLQNILSDDKIQRMFESPGVFITQSGNTIQVVLMPANTLSFDLNKNLTHPEELGILILDLI